MKAKCIVCGRALVAIGNARGNGVSHHDDWVTRQYHKKCHKNLIWQKDYISVPYERREHAKSLGARWDPRVRHWYSPNDAVYEKLFNDFAWVDIDELDNAAALIQRYYKWYKCVCK